jgi:hypothetical protein
MATKTTKATRKGAIQWGYDDKGRLIVAQPPGRWANEMPAARWCLLRDNVADLQDVANAINSLRAYPVADVGCGGRKAAVTFWAIQACLGRLEGLSLGSAFEGRSECLSRSR